MKLPLLSGDAVVYLFRTVLLALAYYVMGRLGLLLAMPPGYATIIWPPSGIALAALLLYGPRLWPGIFIGSLIVNLDISGAFSASAGITETTLLIAVGIAVGSTLQTLFARLLVRKAMGIPIALHSWKDMLLLLTLAGPIGCLVAPTIGVTTMYLCGALGSNPTSMTLASNWLTWWKGDTFGMLVFLPLMLIAPGGSAGVRWREGHFRVLPTTAVLALMVPLGLTFYAWKAIVHFTYEKNVAQFVVLAEESEKALQNRIDSYRQALLGGAGFFLGSDYVSRDEWRRYVRAIDVLNNHPGMNGIGWIAAIEPGDLKSFVAKMRAEGEPDFTVHPADAPPENFIISYIEPREINQRAVGLNIAFESNRRRAATLARDTGEPTITRRIQLVQDEMHGSGFLLLLPIYDDAHPVNTVDERRAAFRGWVYTPLLGKEFLAGLTNSLGRTLDLQLYDGEESADHLIYSSNVAGASTEPVFTARKTLDIGRQRWMLVWQSTPAFEKLAVSYEPMLVLAGGLMLTAMFGAFLLMVTRRTETVQQQVRERTQQLQDSEEALKSSEETFRSAMEHASIGMALVGPGGRFLKVNQALCDLLGYAPAELQERDSRSITHPDDLPANYIYLEQALAGERQSYQMERRYFHKDGHAIWTLVSVSLVRSADNSPRYFVVQIQDITQRKEMDRMKSEFISTVSHELRTPLTSIRGSLGLIAAGVLGQLPQKLESMIRIALTNSERLVRIINDILDIEKIESGKLELYIRNVPVAAFLKQAVDATDAYGAKFNVRFLLQAADERVEVLADQDRLMQVMANLLSNAAKFSPQGGQVMVRASQNAARVRIEVEDHGTGIPEEFRTRIFDKFAQADSSSSRRFEGTGLGLSITRQLVEAMGGTIGFMNNPGGQGATFYFELPRASVVTQPPVPDSDTGRILYCGDEATITDGTPALHRVLHVEDDIDLSKVLGAALAGHAQVLAVPTLSAARQLLNEESFSLIVLDLALPDGNGLSLLDQIHKLVPGPVPVVILSASETPRDIQQRVAAALVKSRMSETRIVETILTLLRKRRHVA